MKPTGRARLTVALRDQVATIAADLCGKMREPGTNNFTVPLPSADTVWWHGLPPRARSGALRVAADLEMGWAVSGC
jgi:hypothetical protein